jgi:hypothetical protein
VVTTTFFYTKTSYLLRCFTNIKDVFKVIFSLIISRDLLWNDKPQYVVKRRKWNQCMSSVGHRFRLFTTFEIFKSSVVYSTPNRKSIATRGFVSDLYKGAYHPSMNWIAEHFDVLSPFYHSQKKTHFPCCHNIKTPEKSNPNMTFFYRYLFSCRHNK